MTFKSKKRKAASSRAEAAKKAKSAAAAEANREPPPQITSEIQEEIKNIHNESSQEYQLRLKILKRNKLQQCLLARDEREKHLELLNRHFQAALKAIDDEYTHAVASLKDVMIEERVAQSNTTQATDRKLRSSKYPNIYIYILFHLTSSDIRSRFFEII